MEEEEILPELRLAARVSQGFYSGRAFGELEPGESFPDIMRAVSLAFKDMVNCVPA